MVSSSSGVNHPTEMNSTLTTSMEQFLELETRVAVPGSLFSRELHTAADKVIATF